MTASHHPIPDRIAAAAKEIADTADRHRHKPRFLRDSVYLKSMFIITALIADLQRAEEIVKMAGKQKT